jgi:hypothetical protein
MKNATLHYAFRGLIILGVAVPLFAQDKATQNSASTSRSTIGALTNQTAIQAVAISEISSIPPAEPFGPGIFSNVINPSIYKPEKEIYAVTIELAHLSWPRLIGRSNDVIGARLALGLNRPRYGFRKELSMAGNLDLKIEGIIHGVLNSACITLAYNMRRSLKKNDTRMRVLVDKVVFMVGIPVGRW